MIQRRGRRATLRARRVALMSQEERREEHIRLAAMPPPRIECPGCLQGLMSAEQEQRGCCNDCAPTIVETISGILADERERAYVVPRRVQMTQLEHQAAVERAETLAREAAEALTASRLAEARMRKAAMECGTCLRCYARPAMATNLCVGCDAAWRQEWMMQKAEKKRGS